MKSTGCLFVMGLVCGTVALGAQTRLAAQQQPKATPPQQPAAPAQPKPPSPAALPAVDEQVKQPTTTPPTTAAGVTKPGATPAAPGISAPPPSKGAPAVPAQAPAGTVAAPAPPAPEGVAPAAAAVTTPEPDRMPRGPSIYETGRVGRMGVSDSGVKIKHTQVVARPPEQRVQGEPARAERPAGSTATGGSLNQVALGRELRPKLNLLKDCRVQVARQKRMGAKEITAGALTLRWVILPSGQVTDTEVVALSPVDGRVIDCVKRQMSVWSFTAPTGGPAQVERPLKF